MGEDSGEGYIISIFRPDTTQSQTGDSPIPINTKNPVIKRPKSTAALPELSIKSSGLAHRAQIQFGRGAIT